jgi:hypothetical protein
VYGVEFNFHFVDTIMMNNAYMVQVLHVVYLFSFIYFPFSLIVFEVFKCLLTEVG